MRKKTQTKRLRLSRETLSELSSGGGAAAMAISSRDLPMCSCLSCTYDNECCTAAAINLEK